MPNIRMFRLPLIVHFSPATTLGELKFCIQMDAYALHLYTRKLDACMRIIDGDHKDQ